MKSIETERKYIIKKPELEELRAVSGYTVSHITQTYLDTVRGVTERVRERRYGDNTAYTHTKKVRISSMSAIEDEREIAESEYRGLLLRRKPNTKAIEKTRHTFPYLGILFEIDEYPEWQNSCIMEYELKDEGESAELPPFISVIREVTGDRAYSNAGMAESFPKEDV